LSIGRHYVCAIKYDDQVNCWVNNTGSPGTHPFDRKIEIPKQFASGTHSIKVGVNVICGQTLVKELICWSYDFQSGHGHQTNTTFVPESLLKDAKQIEVSESIGAGIDKDGKFLAWHLKDKQSHTFDLKNVVNISAG